jgi:hypothetical protein
MFFGTDFDRVTLPIKRPARAADIHDRGGVTRIQCSASDQQGRDGIGRFPESPDVTTTRGYALLGLFDASMGRPQDG